MKSLSNSCAQTQCATPDASAVFGLLTFLRSNAVIATFGVPSATHLRRLLNDFIVRGVVEGFVLHAGDSDRLEPNRRVVLPVSQFGGYEIELARTTPDRVPQAMFAHGEDLRVLIGDYQAAVDQHLWGAPFQMTAAAPSVCTKE
jgi:hypothetical protein